MRLSWPAGRVADAGREAPVGMTALFQSAVYRDANLTRVVRRDVMTAPPRTGGTEGARGAARRVSVLDEGSQVVDVRKKVSRQTLHVHCQRAQVRGNGAQSRDERSQIRHHGNGRRDDGLRMVEPRAEPRHRIAE